MNNILIIGAGGHSTVVVETIKLTNEYDEILFLDDNLEKKIFGKNIFGSTQMYSEENIKKRFSNAIVALGDSTLRINWIEKLINEGYEVPTVIHPKTYISPSATIGIGSVVFAGAVIQPEVNIGIGVIINTSSSVDHNVQIADGTHVCPGVSIAGNVNIGKNSWVGIGSSIIQGINIGNNATIGAGSVVINDIPDKSKVVGVPAKPILKN